MEPKGLGRSLAAQLPSSRVKAAAPAITGPVKSNSGFIRKGGIIGLALWGAATAAIPMTAGAGNDNNEAQVIASAIDSDIFISVEISSDRLAFIRKIFSSPPSDKRTEMPVQAAAVPGKHFEVNKVWEKSIRGVPVPSPVFSHDGSTLTVVSHKGTISMFDTKSGNLLWEKGTDGRVELPSQLSPDGSRLAVVSDDGMLSLVHGHSGKLIWKKQIKDTTSYLKISPDSEKLAMIRDIGVLSMTNANSGDLLWEKELDRIVSLEFSPDGKTFVDAYFAKKLSLLDASSGNPVWEMKPEGRVYGSPIFSQDGAALAIGILRHNDDKILLLETASGKLSREVQTGPMAVPKKFSPDNKKLVVVNDTSTLSVINADTGTQIWKKEIRWSKLSNFRFSPDGSILAVAGHYWDGSDDYHTLYLLDAASGKSLWELPMGGNKIRSLAFSPDNTKLALGSQDHKLYLFDIIEKL